MPSRPSLDRMDDNPFVVKEEMKEEGSKLEETPVKENEKAGNEFGDEESDDS